MMNERVLNVLAAVSECEEVRENLDRELYDSGILDSLATVRLIVALSEEFGLDISPSDFDREAWATPRKIISYIEQQQRAS